MHAGRDLIRTFGYLVLLTLTNVDADSVFSLSIWRIVCLEATSHFTSRMNRKNIPRRHLSNGLSDYKSVLKNRATFPTEIKLQQIHSLIQVVYVSIQIKCESRSSNDELSTSILILKTLEALLQSPLSSRKREDRSFL
jgi:hypothetical protein